MVLKRIGALFGKSRTASSEQIVPFDAPLAPAQSFAAIGDIHGRLDLLEALIAQIDARSDAPEITVFLGDYIDRGTQSAQVLERLFALNTSAPARNICLMGNHEKMMLEFLDDPLGRGKRWLHNGGLETMQSFGLRGLENLPQEDSLMDVCSAFEEAVSPDLLTWMRGLPAIWQSGNICCVHAGMDPALGPKEQSRRTLLWGHKDFMNTVRDDGIWAVHGHTIVKTAVQTGGRIALDTGAYRSGVLSGAIIMPDLCEFVTARA